MWGCVWMTSRRLWSRWRCVSKRPSDAHSVKIGDLATTPVSALRHLDTMQHRTLVVAAVPRVQCDEHGVIQITVPWSDPKSRFIALFEALVIDGLKEASFSAVARQLSLSCDHVVGIQDRAVR